MMNLGFGQQPYMQQATDFSVAAPIAERFGGMGGRGVPHGRFAPVAPPPPPGMADNLAALYAMQGQAPNFMQQFNPMQPQMGGAPNFMDPRMIGGGFPRYSGNGYDSSGINPHGMYGGGPQLPQAQLPQMQFPQNPGGFMAMRNLGFGGR